MIDLVKNYSVIARRMRGSVIRELLKLTNKPDIISFAGGLPDPKGFPIEEIKDITQYVLDKKSVYSLQYGPTEGDPELIEELVKLAKEQGEDIGPENILVTVASQQGLDLVSKVFIDPSDPIIVELPSYIGGLQAFTCYGAHMYGVPTDDEGIIIDKFQSTLERLKSEEEHYKFLYLVPDFQNPAGVTLSLERRKKVIELCEEYNLFIIEDTPYRQIRFEGKDLPSLYSLDKKANVIQLQTFSKIFVPGLRVGWVKARKQIISKLAVAKQSVDLCTPSFSQAIAAEFCKRGLLKIHIEKIKKIYKKKKDVMIQALETYMPKVEDLSWTKPEGGLFLWVRLPEYVDADEMFYDAVEDKVAYVIGSAFHCNNTGKNTLRLNFSYPTEDEIAEGIKRLGKCIEKRLLVTTHK